MRRAEHVIFDEPMQPFDAALLVAAAWRRELHLESKRTAEGAKLRILLARC